MFAQKYLIGFFKTISGSFEQKETKATMERHEGRASCLEYQTCDSRIETVVFDLCYLRFLLFKRAFMHPQFEYADRLSREAIGGAIEVHKLKGPGLLESIYEKCLIHELALRGLQSVRQRMVTIEYKDMRFDEELKFDVLVEGCLLLELKAVQEVLPIHKAQLFSYMKLMNIPLGLLINFHEMRLVDGVTRMILPGANL